MFSTIGSGYSSVNVSYCAPTPRKCVTPYVCVDEEAPSCGEVGQEPTVPNDVEPLQKIEIGNQVPNSVVLMEIVLKATQFSLAVLFKLYDTLAEQVRKQALQIEHLLLWQKKAMHKLKLKSDNPSITRPDLTTCSIAGNMGVGAGYKLIPQMDCIIGEVLECNVPDKIATQEGKCTENEVVGRRFASDTVMKEDKVAYTVFTKQAKSGTKQSNHMSKKLPKNQPMPTNKKGAKIRTFIKKLSIPTNNTITTAQAIAKKYHMRTYSKVDRTGSG